MDMNHFKLQFITHFTDTYSYLDSARMALEGGCRWVQLRMKHASDEETEAVAVEVQKLCRTYGATFLIDDRVELVRKLKADGVHLAKRHADSRSTKNPWKGLPHRRYGQHVRRRTGTL